jgi:hypothetical protein
MNQTWGTQNPSIQRLPRATRPTRLPSRKTLEGIQCATHLTNRAWGTLRLSMVSRELPCVLLATIAISNPNSSVRATRHPPYLYGVERNAVCCSRDDYHVKSQFLSPGHPPTVVSSFRALPSRKTLEGIQCATRGLVYI